MIALSHFAAPCRADGAALTGAGGIVSVMDTPTSIRLEYAVVKIKLPEARVSAQFIFKNVGAGTWVKLGFPERATGLKTMTGDGPLTTMREFHATLDGKPIVITRRLTAAADSSKVTTVWWTGKAYFARGQVRKVHDTFVGGLATLDSSGAVGFHYMLAGGDWTHPIRRAKIICDLSAMGQHSPLYYQPSSGIRTPSRITWNFADYTPARDIVIGWMGPFAAVTVNGVPVWLPADNGVAQVYTGASRSVELDPFLFTWPAQAWGGLAAMKSGTDVIVSAKTAAVWLGAKLTIGAGGYAVRISRAGQNASIGLHPGGLAAWSVRGDHYVMNGPTAKALFASARYCSGDSLPERHGYTALYLRRVVKALGGRSYWNATLNRLFITFGGGSVAARTLPAATTIAPAPVPVPVPIPAPSPLAAPPTPQPVATSPHTVGM